MDRTNIETIRRSFTLQAEKFESSAMNFSKKEYLDYTVSATGVTKEEVVLEVAAGTCACGRALAPYAKSVICLDITPAMLEVGRQEAQKEHLNNMIFTQGMAEKLPFLDESFDVVISRLAFHHFVDIYQPFREMVRVLKPGGRLVVVDMEAAEESLRKYEDEIETWRDHSHVKNLSREEITSLFRENQLDIRRCESTRIPVDLQAWMDLTKTPKEVRDKILGVMYEEMEDGKKTGFEPYRTEKGIFFWQRWLLITGIKLGEYKLCRL